MDGKSAINQEDAVARGGAGNEPPRSAADETDGGRALLRQRQEFSLMLEVSKLIIAELDLEKVLQLVADKARDIVHAELVLLPMLNEERSRYVYLAASGADAERARGVSLSAELGMCGWVLKHQRSLLFGEGIPFAMDEKTAWEAGRQSAVLVPLFGRNRVIGGLSALGKEGGGCFTGHDLDLLTMFANQVSIAIENAMLFGEVNRQVDEIKNKEQLIRESEQRFRKLLASVTSYLYTVSLESGRPVATTHSPECEAVTGFAPGEYAADPDLWYRMIYEEDRQLVLDAATRILTAETAITIEHRIRHKQGSLRWVRSTLVPHFSRDGRQISYDGVITDITEQKKTHEEIRKLNEELEARVRKRTAELEERNYELEQLNKAFVGRELRMAELKDKIRELEKIISDESAHTR